MAGKGFPARELSPTSILSSQRIRKNAETAFVTNIFQIYPSKAYVYQVVPISCYTERT